MLNAMGANKSKSCINISFFLLRSWLQIMVYVTTISERDRNDSKAFALLSVMVFNIIKLLALRPIKAGELMIKEL